MGGSAAKPTSKQSPKVQKRLSACFTASKASPKGKEMPLSESKPSQWRLEEAYAKPNVTGITRNAR